MFNTGFDFFRSLLCDYGKMEAVRIANDYLDTQASVYGSGYKFFKQNPDEYKFCVELYQAVKQSNINNNK